MSSELLRVKVLYHRPFLELTYSCYKSLCLPPKYHKPHRAAAHLAAQKDFSSLNTKIIILVSLSHIKNSIIFSGAHRSHTKPVEYPKQSSQILCSDSQNVFYNVWELNAPQLKGKTRKYTKCNNNNFIIWQCVLRLEKKMPKTKKIQKYINHDAE